MVASGPQAAKRSLVKVLLWLAVLYAVRLEVSRESPDKVLIKAYKRISLKAHPDKGGKLEHAQALNAAKDAWDKAREQGGRKAGRPKKRADGKEANKGSAGRRGTTDDGRRTTDGRTTDERRTTDDGRRTTDGRTTDDGRRTDR